MKTMHIVTADGKKIAVNVNNNMDGAKLLVMLMSCGIECVRWEMVDGEEYSQACAE